MKIQQLAQDEKEKRANIRFQKMVDKVDGAVRATGKLIESYNVTELRTLVICYKREGDAPVPNTRQQLLQSKVHRHLPSRGADSMKCTCCSTAS